MPTFPLLLLGVLALTLTSDALLGSLQRKKDTGAVITAAPSSGSQAPSTGCGSDCSCRSMPYMRKVVRRLRRRVRRLENVNKDVQISLADLKARVSTLENPTGTKPVTTPVTSPVTTPVTTPVKTPVTTPVTTPATCPASFPLELGRSCYFASKQAVNFSEAVANCAAMGGKLVEIETSLENQYLKNLALVNPDKTCDSKADVVFVLDESGSVGASNFETVKNFVKSIVNSLDVGLDKVRVGLFTFSDAARHTFHLDTHSNKAAILSAISAIKYMMGGTNTAAALQYTRATMFTAPHERANVPNVAVVITDGASSNAVATAAAAAAARAAGIKLIAVGVGSGISVPELNSIASDPDSMNVFSVAGGFAALNGTVTAVSSMICTFTGYWFGATDVGTEGTYRRPSDKAAIVFKDWLTGQPDNAGGNENCAHISTDAHHAGQWTDVSCASTNKYFCEYDLA